MVKVKAISSQTFVVPHVSFNHPMVKVKAKIAEHLNDKLFIVSTTLW